MSLRITRFLICSVLFFASPVLLADHSQVEDRYSGKRKIFQELVDQIEAGQTDSALARRDQLQGYPLLEYFDYLVLRQQIKGSSEPASLLDRVSGINEDSRLQRRLLGAMKNRSVTLGRWQDYNLVQAHDNAPVHPCDDLLSGYNNGKAKQFVETTRDLWADVDRHTANCDKAFAQLLGAVSDVPTAALWHRTVALIKRGDLDTVTDLLKYFNSHDRKLVQSWIKGYKNPADALRSQSSRGATVHHKAIAEMLLNRWARNDLPAAIEFWRDNAKHFGFSEADTRDKIASYSVLAVKRGIPQAAALLNSASATRDVRYWRVRIALQNSDWQHCIDALDQLTAEEQNMPRWRYWRARCLESQGFQSAADRIYEGIAGAFEYYGFLAADRLSQSYRIKASALPEVANELHQLKDQVQITQALEYFFADLPWEGRRKWNRVLKGASEQTKLAAAQLAHSVGWYDRAVVAAYNANANRALQWLFPQAYKAEVDRYIDYYDVPEEFVYGVMRRESRFTSDVKSPAGAVGLMQLMPATAKEMGQQIGVKAPAWRLTDSQLNIRLGIRYLDHVFGRFDNNLAYAAAAYNAGPSRVKKWLADRPVAADIWVETIPFDETRAYVKAVLFNTVVSEWLMRDGRVTRLQNRMNTLSVTQLVE